MRVKKETVSVGIIGFGTVGSGTARILLESAAIIRERTGFVFDLKESQTWTLQGTGVSAFQRAY